MSTYVHSAGVWDIKTFSDTQTMAYASKLNNTCGPMFCKDGRAFFRQVVHGHCVKDIWILLGIGCASCLLT